MTAITQYYANVGIKVDEKALSSVDRYLAKIEKKLVNGLGKSDFQITPKINVAAFEKHLRQVLRGVGGKSSPLRVNVQVSEQGIRKSLQETLSKTPFRAPVIATLSRTSILNIRSQLQAALSGLLINARIGGVTGGRQTAPRGSASSGQGGRYSWSPNPSGKAGTAPHLTEWLAGRPDKSSLSAANRRWGDKLIKDGIVGSNAGGITGFLSESVFGGLGRVGSSTMAGRGIGAIGSALGGARGGALGLVGSSIITGASAAFTGIWGALGTIITAPFKLVSSAASAVTGAFYNVALAALPLIGAFAMIDNKVIQTQQRGIALNTVSKSLGSTGAVEGKWLMDMANRDGLRYDTLVQPYTSFIASASPAVGLDMAKNIFEGMTQFGVTRGSDDESMKRAMVAVSQMAGKGKVGAEELRQQLGDAQGFGEMQSIFAEAYQMSQGRSITDMKRGQKALEELYDAMQKGNVYSAKVLPYVAEIAKRMAEGGLEEARTSAFAERGRFMNQITEGWQNFTNGGGASGLAFFWREIMMPMGEWWNSNGAMLGSYFEKFMYDINMVRLGLKEFFEFAYTGQTNSFVEYMKQQGIDLELIRTGLVSIFDKLGEMLSKVAELLGFTKEGDLGKGVADKLGVFVENVSKILTHIDSLLNNVTRFMTAWNYLSQLNATQMATLVVPGTQANRAFAEMVNSAGSGVMDVGRATGSAFNTSKDVLTGSGSPTVIPKIPDKRYSEWGDSSIPRFSESLSRPVATKHDIQLTVNGNVDIAQLLNTPEAQTELIKSAGMAINKSFTSALPSAPE